MKNTFLLILYFSFIWYCFSKNIAIVGGGIGGLSTAYFLKKYNTDLFDSITVFEKNDHFGGRVKSKEVFNEFKEFGATFFLKENKFLMEIIQDLKLQYKEHKSSGDNTMGFFKEKKIVKSIGNYKVIEFFRVIWNYGFAPFTAGKLVTNKINEFLKIYDFFTNNKSFKSVEEMMNALGFIELLNQYIEDFMISNGVNENYFKEVIAGVLSGIYNQGYKLNAFSGLITLAGMNVPSYIIKGGNKKIADEIVDHLKNRKGVSLKTGETISKILKKSDKYILYNDKNTNLGEFDVVILAFPQIEKITFEFQTKTFNVLPPKITYVCYILATIKPDAFKNYTFLFNIDKDTINHISEILVQGNIKDKYLFKIQSDTPLSKTELEYLFNDGYLLIEEFNHEFAYPKLIPIKLNKNSRFELDKNLFYLNAIEISASCMELAIISGRNIINIIKASSYHNSNKEDL